MKARTHATSHDLKCQFYPALGFTAFDLLEGEDKVVMFDFNEIDLSNYERGKSRRTILEESDSFLIDLREVSGRGLTKRLRRKQIKHEAHVSR